MDFCTKDPDDIFQRKQKESVDGRFIPRMIRSNVSTMLNPLFSSKRVERVNLLGGEIEWERVRVSGYFH